MKSWIKYIGVGLLVVLVVGLIYGYQKHGHLITTGTGLVAHQVCSCLYVSNRELQECLDDRWPNMKVINAAPILIGEVPGVQATSYVSTRTAAFEPEFGCTLQD